MSVCNCYFSRDYNNIDYTEYTWYQCLWFTLLVIATILASFVIADMTSVDVTNNRDACYMWCDGALLAPHETSTPRTNHNNQQKCMWANQFCEAVQASCGAKKSPITTRNDWAC